MVLPTSGPLSLSQIQTEFGGTPPISISEYYAAHPSLPATGTISIGDFRGLAASNMLTQGVNRQQILASDFVSSGGALVIPANTYIWSDDTSIAALTIDVSNITIVNNGFIIGRGGNGGNRNANGQAGGPAIRINSGITNVTIMNNSGAFIAGGGGGGAGNQGGAGGGGAGGGRGGTGANNTAGGAGGLPGQAGGNGATEISQSNSDGTLSSGGGSGGGAGGGGAAFRVGRDGNVNAGGGGGGGGRILPGTGGAGGIGSPTNRTGNGLAGGSANAAGTGTSSLGPGAGGGGWSARGGNTNSRSGGAGGAAITGAASSSFFTPNGGTIYGSNVLPLGTFVTYEIIGAGGGGGSGWITSNMGTNGGASTLQYTPAGTSTRTTITSQGGRGGRGGIQTGWGAGSRSEYGSGGAGGANSDSSRQSAGSPAPTTSYGAGGGGGGANPFSGRNGGEGGYAGGLELAQFAYTVTAWNSGSRITRYVGQASRGTVAMAPGSTININIGTHGTNINPDPGTDGRAGAHGFCRLTINGTVTTYTATGAHTVTVP